MNYKIYTDRNENFECEVSVKNASLKGSMARLVMESEEGINFMFNGKIENGKCIVPIKRLKGILEENSKGKMFLEMVVEYTYFKPWQSEFIVEEHTSVKVKVNEQQQRSNKPIVEVKTSPIFNKPSILPSRKEVSEMWIPIKEISTLCERFNIGKSNIIKKKSDFGMLIKEYFNANPEFESNKINILRGLMDFLK
jgi:hypothetical protein